MAIHNLTARNVQAAGVGDHADGGGLFLKVTPTGASWTLRYTAPDGRRRELGCGAAERATLATAGLRLTAARKIANEARALVATGIDPIEARNAMRVAAQAETDAKKARFLAQRTTLARAARRYHADVIEPSRTSKHGAQWIASLERSVPPEIWNAPIDTITPASLLDAMAPLRKRIPVTADRVRQRLEVVFDDAMFAGHCTTNPAVVIKRKLAERPAGREKGHFAALPFAEVPAFVQALRDQPGTAARALELALLCASRTAEVIECRWDEIDLTAAVWRIPAARMKGKQPHDVFLSPRALEIIRGQIEQQGDFVFASPRDLKRPMSNMSMLVLLRRMGMHAKTTVHGLCRASFSTWANENAVARSDVIEACLAHREADAVRRAYNRASFAAERKALLVAWANYCNGVAMTIEASTKATVHHLEAAAA